MADTKHLVVFGAGKSATVLIEYLKDIATLRRWQVRIADASLAVAQAKTGIHPFVKPVEADVDNDLLRASLIMESDLVISLLPPGLHFLVAKDCLAHRKHLLTASYVDEDMAELAEEINRHNMLFLCEMGLDPGIDHMSAMQLINRIRSKGGVISSFVSHCGGLVAPESDDNPWHYKISWNPKNILMAGKAGAVYREKGEVKSVKYEKLFNNCSEVMIDGIGNLAYYPNRDSLSYVPVYKLESAGTFMRTTLRHPDFCRGWKKVVELGLTDEKNIFQTDSLSVSAFLKAHFDRSLTPFPLENDLLQSQFEYLGLLDETLINKHESNSAEVLQSIIEKKWELKENDKDMVVMLHEIAYEVGEKLSTVKSLLIVKGQDNLHTAMAKTVGLPLGIAATLLLDGKIAERGLHTPTVPGIYEPVLAELANHGIIFREVN